MDKPIDPEKCPVKVYTPRDYTGPMWRQCSRRPSGRRGLCSFHERRLDDRRVLPLLDGTKIFADLGIF